MKKILLAMSSCLLWLSCSEDDSTINQLRDRVYSLESRMDSFQLALKECQLGNSNVFRKSSPGTIKKTTAKNKEPYSSSAGYSSGQCNGITKKGTRCKRRVRSGLYCYQH